MLQARRPEWRLCPSKLPAPTSFHEPFCNRSAHGTAQLHWCQHQCAEHAKAPLNQDHPDPLLLLLLLPRTVIVHCGISNGFATQLQLVHVDLRGACHDAQPCPSQRRPAHDCHPGVTCHDLLCQRVLPRAQSSCPCTLSIMKSFRLSSADAAPCLGMLTGGVLVRV